MRALLPAGTKVEHKTGTLSGYTGDVGFVTLPDGRRIAVALFARGGVNRPAVIASAARTIYDAFDAEPPRIRAGARMTFPARAAPAPRRAPACATNAERSLADIVREATQPASLLPAKPCSAGAAARGRSTPAL
jgi:hypothetical protein